MCPELLQFADVVAYSGFVAYVLSGERVLVGESAIPEVVDGLRNNYVGYVFLEFTEVSSRDVVDEVLLAEELDVSPSLRRVRVIDDVAAYAGADRAVIVGNLVLAEAGNGSEESALALPGLADDCDVEGVA